MRVVKIEKSKDDYRIFNVSLEPNLIEKIFGVKERVESFKDSGRTYVYGGGVVYLRKDGSQLKNDSSIANKLDNFQNAW